MNPQIITNSNNIIIITVRLSSMKHFSIFQLIVLVYQPGSIPLLSAALYPALVKNVLIKPAEDFWSSWRCDGSIVPQVPESNNQRMPDQTKIDQKHRKFSYSGWATIPSKHGKKILAQSKKHWDEEDGQLPQVSSISNMVANMQPDGDLRPESVAHLRGGKGLNVGSQCCYLWSGFTNCVTGKWFWFSSFVHATVPYSTRGIWVQGLKTQTKMQSIKSVRIIKYIVSGLGNPIKMSKVMTKLEREWKEVALSQERKREESYQKYKMND